MLVDGTSKSNLELFAKMLTLLKNTSQRLSFEERNKNSHWPLSVEPYAAFAKKSEEDFVLMVTG